MKGLLSLKLIALLAIAVTANPSNPETENDHQVAPSTNYRVVDGEPSVSTVADDTGGGPGTHNPVNTDILPDDGGGHRTDDYYTVHAIEVQPPGIKESDQDGTNTPRPDRGGQTGSVEPGTFVCQPHITIHPPASTTNSGTCCNCSTVRDMISSELARFMDSCRQQGNGGQNDMGRQLEQLHSSVSDLAAVLKAFQYPELQLSANLMPIPKDCSEVLAKGATNSGVYMVKPVDFTRAFEVYCDMETDGGGWTVFQRRIDGSVDFDRNFASYRRGFGDRDSEFWLGNDNLHRLTMQDEYELRVDLTDFDGNSAYAVYDQFRLADVDDNFRLTVGAYAGTAGDAMENHNNQPFTTKDRDNDNWGTKNCAKEYHSAWWHNSCYYASLNGDYLGGVSDSYGKGVVWYQWKGYYYSLKSSEMKFRMKN